MPVFDLDKDDLNRSSGGGAEDVREFPVSLRRGADATGIRVGGLVGPSESIEERCRREGATHVDIPVGTDPRMRREGRLPTTQLGDICHTIMTTFDRLRAAHPEMPIDYLRAAVITEHPAIERSGFFYRYPGMFMTFTDPALSPHDREKCMQTILLKLRLEQGEIEGEEANQCIAELMGVPPEQRERMYKHLREVHLEEERRRPAGA